MKFTLYLPIVALLVLVFSSCSLSPTAKKEKDIPPKAEYVNPYPKGTYEHFLARPDYYQTLDTYRNLDEYMLAKPSETSIVLYLKTLRGKLYNKAGTVLLDYPIASGVSKHPTPRGRFKIMEKIIDKESNLYGKIIDAEGVVLNSEADSRKHKVPRGARFDGADMPYWMRLTSYGIGMHQGNVPTNPRRVASHGCIRHTMEAVKLVFEKVQVGTPVKIQ